MLRKRQVIAEGYRKGLEGALEAINEALLLKEGRDETINLGSFDNIRRFVPNGGPIFVSSGILAKIGKGKHQIKGAIDFIKKVLKEHVFVVRYKKGVYNFYASWESGSNTRYAVVGVSVRDK